jgi:hypothetical protein
VDEKELSGIKGVTYAKNLGGSGPGKLRTTRVLKGHYITIAAGPP